MKTLNMLIIIFILVFFISKINSNKKLTSQDIDEKFISVCSFDSYCGKKCYGKEKEEDCIAMCISDNLGCEKLV